MVLNKIQRFLFIFLKLAVFANLLLFFVGCLPKESKMQQKTETGLERYNSKKDLTKIRVGYCSPTLDAPFYVALEDAVRNGVEHFGMQYFSTDGQSDIAKQVVAVEDLLAKNIDVLILNPIDPKALVPVLQSAVNRGVKVFIVDSFIEDNAPYISAIIADNQKNGELLGDWLVKNHQGDMNIAIISGNQGNPVGREKRLGFIRGITDSQLKLTSKVDFKVVSQGWGGWSNNGGLKAAEDILVAHPETNIMFAENDAMAMGALKAITEMGLQKKIILLGFDGQKEAYELLIKGLYGATAQNSPSILGHNVTEIIARYLNGEKVKRLIYTPSVLIDKSNVVRFYDQNALF